MACLLTVSCPWFSWGLLFSIIIHILVKILQFHWSRRHFLVVQTCFWNVLHQLGNNEQWVIKISRENWLTGTHCRYGRFSGKPKRNTDSFKSCSDRHGLVSKLLDPNPASVYPLESYHKTLWGYSSLKFWVLSMYRKVQLCLFSI